MGPQINRLRRGFRLGLWAWAGFRFRFRGWPGLRLRLRLGFRLWFRLWFRLRFRLRLRLRLRLGFRLGLRFRFVGPAAIALKPSEQGWGAFYDSVIFGAA